jgi:protein-disulfide isomerase
MNDQKNIFQSLNGKNVLLLGMVASFFVVCTIGFFILGAYVLKNGNSVRTTITNNTIPTSSIPKDNTLPTGVVPPVNDDDHIRGNENAEITIIEYSDFECPFCQRFHPTLQRVVDEYEGKVRWIYRHFPLTSIHPNAQKLAEGSECATELGGNKAFWEYADAVFGTSDYSNESLALIAKNIGLNTTKFSNCLTSGTHTQKVQAMTNAGLTAGVNGAPGSFLIGRDRQAQLISGALPYETIKTAIDAELSK